MAKLHLKAAFGLYFTLSGHPRPGILPAAIHDMQHPLRRVESLRQGNATLK